MLYLERLSSLDDIAQRCCTLCAVNPGTLAYVLCRPEEEQHLRETIFKENLRIGNRFVWYEMRRETVIGDHWSRIRLLPFEDSKDLTQKTKNIRGDLLGAEYVNIQVIEIARYGKFGALMYSDPVEVLWELLDDDDEEEDEI